MKKLEKVLRGHKYLCFLDFEGTQFSHELIAYGAVFASLDKKHQIKKYKRPIKVYVKAKNKIGKFVEGLTGINQDDLNRKGVSFLEAMKALKKYCGISFKKTLFVTFGNHDMRILNQSISYNLNAPTDITAVIQKNYLDYQSFITEFIKDENNNPYSLERYLEVFNISFTGTAHDPEYDALNLLKLYEAFINEPEIVVKEYLKVLKKLNHLPEPVKKSIAALASGEDMTAENFNAFVREYLK